MQWHSIDLPYLKKLKSAIQWRGWNSLFRIPYDVINAKGKDNCRGKEVCGKFGQQNPDHHINDCDFSNKCANCGGDHPVYSRSCESWRQVKEILKVKHQNNIPFLEARKILVGSKATTYAQAVQHNKSTYNYESMIKTLIQLEQGEWEGYINKIKLTFNIVRAPETPNTSGDLAENKELPTQT